VGVDVGLTHIALPVRDITASISFYSKYAGMVVIHRRSDESGKSVVWLSDRTRPFAVVLIEEGGEIRPLAPSAHLGVGCESRSQVDSLAAEAKTDGRLLLEPKDSGYPVGYWTLISDPDGHTLELSYGQEVGLAVSGSAPLEDTK
jgi:catechol 2,3-dioxygenase-like lactoylglutathione lyase family enzyme